MKVGVRKPSVSKRVKASTTGRAKRSVKKAVVPYYGQKGTGIVKDPKKAIYNKVYSKTTVGVDDFIAGGTGYSSKASSNKSTSSYKKKKALSEMDINKCKSYSKTYKVWKNYNNGLVCIRNRSCHSAGWNHYCRIHEGTRRKKRFEKSQK